jgi:hypothetical protein
VGRRPRARLVLAPASRGCPAMLGAPACAAKLATLAARAPLRQIAASQRYEARFARWPALLRFSAAHEARPRPAAHAFADTVVVFVDTSPGFDACTTDVARAAGGGAPGGRGGGCRAALGGARRAGPVRWGGVGGAEQRSPGVGARSALRTSDSRRPV